MVYKRFRIQVLLRILLIIANILLLSAIYIQVRTYYITSFVLLLVLLYQVVVLIHYVEKTNRDLANFLEAIRYSDFSRNFQTEGMGHSFEHLKDTFNSVMDDFQKIRSEKEEHYYYLHNIMEHVGIGIIAYRSDGHIEMINKAAKRLFQIRHLENIKELADKSPELVDNLLNIGQYDNTLVKLQDQDDLLQLSIHGTQFILNERQVKLITIKDIQLELEAQEMEAWQKLIRVLTHEIMNSIAPISSLTSTANLMVNQMLQMIDDPHEVPVDRESIMDIRTALDTIHKRSVGLIHFVQTYRNLTKIPKPNFSIFPIKRLLDNIHKLLNEEFETHAIQCDCYIRPESLQLTADEQLIEQVLINLMKNSIHALEGRKDARIIVEAFENNRGRIIIQVKDNGRGILPDVQDKIFIPFFTTKAKGSGIGLSLSKQILRLHNGNISVHSIPDQETIFSLTF